METTKTILWVEDFDDKDTTVPNDDLDSEIESSGSTVHTDQIDCVFPKEHSNRVELQETVDGALTAIDECFNEFDCVVLDVNLLKGWPDTQSVQESIHKRLSGVGVKFPDDIEYFKRNTGYYLYLYLLCKGFPKDRIIMRTAYNGTSNNNLTNAWDTVFNNAGLIPPTSVGKSDKNKEFHDMLNKLYPVKDNYYLIRRLVFDATKHWINVLNAENCDVNDFVFNAAAAEEKRLSKESLIILLNEINVLIPMRYDEKIGNTLCNILRKLSVPFEAYTNYSKLGKDSSTYLTVMRLMRNWYAHGLFFKKEPSEKEFLFLFIIALRALFDYPKACNDILDYEKQIFKYLNKSNVLPQMPDLNFIEQRIYTFYRDTYEKITSMRELEAKYKIFSTEYWRLLDSLGHDKSDFSGCLYSKLIELIWTNKYPIVLKFNNKIPTIKHTEGFPDSTIVYLNYSISEGHNSDILDCIICADCLSLQQPPCE